MKPIRCLFGFHEWIGHRIIERRTGLYMASSCARCSARKELHFAVPGVRRR